ncbi:MAG: hypothetical protein CMQ65_05055, partial [Gammaproteobacteria bacterium]|nr:hypothetical protein [Gammaproteobacteria bacterium]
MKWNSIETFFLDLDGTLLDLAFDNFFWHEHLPYVYANSKDIEFKKAKEDVAVLTKELEAYDGEKALLRQAKARLLVAENRLNSLKW